MPRHFRHLILLYPLLLVALLSYPQQGHRDTLVIHFAFDSHRIRTEDSTQLAQAVANQKIDSIYVDGYTDKVGSDAYNLALSRRRAIAAGHLVSREAVNASQLHVSGHGIAPTMEWPDSENRRVEVVLFYATASRQRDTPATSTSSASSQANAPHGAPTAANPPPGAPTATTTPSSSPIPRGDSIQVIKREADTAFIALRHINFIVDTPVPTDSTLRILPAYVEQLRRYKDHRFEIDGFVNSIVPLRGAKDPLYILSVDRAKYVYDYLVKAGFDPAKLTYKGMGNSSPINPNPTTRAEMDANMRVEIKVY
ncbi:MAG TPA: OmpA family protein [Puia sp.]|nr:OmpA family protein [Puia sp.]